MVQKLTKVATGIPLRQTNPASVERFLIDKVRDELGDFRDLAVITPVLRVDSEDGDLSGNLANAFGNVMLDVRGTKVHLPFIIHNKELIPFDVIRLGDQEVSYSPDKLRKLVNALDKKARDHSDEGDGDAVRNGNFSIGEVVDRKHIPTGNGFLGSIMQIRDSEIARRPDGMALWQGQDFGSLDDGRLDRQASAEIDVLDAFNEAVEKLAAVKVIPQSAVDAFLADFEKKAAEESQKQIDAVSSVAPQTLETAAVQRGMAKLKDEKLVDVARVASGNDIKFPVAELGTFEYRNGRVYHNIEPWAKNDKERVVTPLKSIVVDSKHGYKVLRDGDKFMTTLETPSAFNFRAERAIGLERGNMYAMELNTSTVSYPFTVEVAYMRDELNAGIHFVDNDRRKNSLFVEAYRCKESFPATRRVGEPEWVSNREFVVLIPRDDQLSDVKHLDRKELQEFIQTHAADPVDAKLALWMAESFFAHDYYILPQQQEFYKLEKVIAGNFTRPDGYFKEGPLTKQAAYDNLNKATLRVERDRMPRSYAVEWTFVNDTKGEGQPGEVSRQSRKQVGLTEDKARQLLQQLGYDNRQIEMFFQIAQRNGREATFALPDTGKAQQTAPTDVAKQKTQGAMSNIAKSTLNAQNFMPVLTDLMGDGLASFIGSAAPQTTDWARGVGSFLKTSYEVAVGVEKVASELHGSTWHELAALTNLKYRLDKVAADIAGGGYAQHLEPVLEKVAELRPAIAKFAHDLITFNRRQLLEFDKPPVAPRLIKQALEQLDGLERYAQAAGLTKQAEEEGPHRLPIPVLGENVVGRSGSMLSAMVPDAVKDEANGAMDSLLDRLGKTASVAHPGK